MTHKTIMDECEALGLTVRQIPANGRKCFEATRPNAELDKVRVYWSISDLGGLLGLPRVIVKGADTHARTLREIRYLVRL
jgi:hypothetical protein